ncbi:hypothetical protein GGR57DRAFT_476490 [Xylariaceae sp. FL1272]|nr:hypothetical protein GGR57DRAFT_476490 [Xylariaceae sp. FL1272]
MSSCSCTRTTTVYTCCHKKRVYDRCYIYQLRTACFAFCLPRCRPTKKEKRSKRVCFQCYDYFRHKFGKEFYKDIISSFLEYKVRHGLSTKIIDPRTVAVDFLIDPKSDPYYQPKLGSAAVKMADGQKDSNTQPYQAEQPMQVSQMECPQAKASLRIRRNSLESIDLAEKGLAKARRGSFESIDLAAEGALPDDYYPPSPPPVGPSFRERVAVKNVPAHDSFVVADSDDEEYDSDNDQSDKKVDGNHQDEYESVLDSVLNSEYRSPSPSPINNSLPRGRPVDEAPQYMKGDVQPWQEIPVFGHMIRALSPESQDRRKADLMIMHMAPSSPELILPRPKKRNMVKTVVVGGVRMSEAVDGMEKKAEVLDLPWIEPPTPSPSVRLVMPTNLKPPTPKENIRTTKPNLRIVTSNLDPPYPDSPCSSITRRPDTQKVTVDQEASGPSVRQPERPATPTITTAEDDPATIMTPAATIFESPKSALKPPYPNSPTPPVASDRKGKGKQRATRPPRIHMPPPQSYNGVFNPSPHICPHNVDFSKRAKGVRNDCKKCAPSYFIEHGIAPSSAPPLEHSPVVVMAPQRRKRGLSHSMDSCFCHSVDQPVRCANCRKKDFVAAAFNQNWI